MASFGENLRRERELRGISLEEIAATTKIKVGFLEAIENDDLARLPGGIFARGFMRTYASYLGLDADQFISEYQPPPSPGTTSWAGSSPPTGLPHLTSRGLRCCRSWWLRRC